MKHKTSLNSMKKGYFKLPHKIYSMSLPATAIAIYGYLARGSEEFNPSINTISKALNLARGTTIKYLHELKNRNIIYLIQQGRERVTSKYGFSNPKDWKPVNVTELEELERFDTDIS